MFNSKYKKQWSDISLKQFAELKAINEREYDDDTDRLCDILSVVYETDINQVPITTYNAMVNGLSFMSDDVPTKRPHSKYKINGVEYEFCSNVAEITTAQFMDFQSYAAQDDIKGMVGCVLIPKDHKYNDGYDMSFLDSVDIVTARATVYFFVSAFIKFVGLMDYYSQREMKKVKRMMSRTKKMNANQIEEMNQNLAYFRTYSNMLKQVVKPYQQL